MWYREYAESGVCRAARYLKTGLRRELIEEPGECDFGLYFDDGDDSSSASADLITGPLFGCVQFQLKS
jgi:hypothetical protein